MVSICTENFSITLNSQDANKQSTTLDINLSGYKCFYYLFLIDFNL